MGTQLVWLKRDLRVEDHAALAEAARAGPVLPVYVAEPSLWRRPELDPSHLVFISESLTELEGRLRDLGLPLIHRIGELPEVFARLHEQVPFEAIHAHEETGLLTTWERDKRVARWCRARGIAFREYPQLGVFRPHPSREGWASRWEARMRAPLATLPDRPRPPPLPPGFDKGAPPTPRALGLPESEKTEAQPGGTSSGRALLESFLERRGETYQTDLSSPVTGWTGCSRLSPHLAYGTVSMREVYRATVRRRRRAEHRRELRWARSLEAFEARLRWHCHFMQKLEDEPELELRNGHRGYDGLREEDPERLSRADRARFDAWRLGQTGFPMVDAAMRCLHKTGWINFRMRAMLASFATHHLWLHWREPAVALAPHFLDFEPGIHFPQFQMQAGTMGINTTRVYNVVKQADDQDPEGTFIRRWVPELAEVPLSYLPAPQAMPLGLQRKVGCIIGKDYPSPIVDHAAAARRAKERLEAMKRRLDLKAESRRVARTHGSRKPPRHWPSDRR